MLSLCVGILKNMSKIKKNKLKKSTCNITTVACCIWLVLLGENAILSHFQLNAANSSLSTDTNRREALLKLQYLCNCMDASF